MANPTADFPTATHSPTDVSVYGSTALGESTVVHANLEGKQEEELEALGLKLGTGSSTPAAEQVLYSTSAGQSAWSALNTLVLAIITVTAPLVIAAGVISMPVATSLANGYLSAIDWSTFNDKAPALGADDNYVTDAEKVVIGNTSGTNTGDNATNSQYSGLVASKADIDQTFYIGTTQVAINRASAALTLAGITLTTPDIGTPSAGVLTNATGLPAASILAGTFGAGVYVMDTSLTTPKIIGGTTTTSDLTLQTTSGVGATGADMHFLVGNNGATEAMTILNNGNVGIGTTDPTNPLHIVSSDAALFQRNSANTIVLKAGGTSATGILFQSNDSAGNSTSFARFTSLVIDATDGSEKGGFAFIIANPTLAEKMRIDNTGNVGIGVTSPTAALHLKAGTATANTAPLQFDSGTLETTPRAGVVEFLTDTFYATITTGAVRKPILLGNGVNFGPAAVISITVVDGQITAIS